jgi:hypothetical protein
MPSGVVVGIVVVGRRGEEEIKTVSESETRQLRRRQ